MRKLIGSMLVIAFALTTIGAHAAPPSNDDLDAAAEIERIPAASALDPTDATAEPGEDTTCGGTRTVWYAWRARSSNPLTVTAQTETPGGMFPQPIGIHVFKKERNVLTSVACASNKVTFTPEKGAHYRFQIAGPTQNITIHWHEGTGFGGGSMADAIEIVAPPSPFREIVGVHGSVDPGEPVPSCAIPGGSYWYTHEAAVDGLYEIHIDATVPIYVQVYREDGGAMVPLGGCSSTQSPNQAADVYALLSEGERIFVQYGNNADPGADQGTFPPVGFFTLGPVA